MIDHLLNGTRQVWRPTTTPDGKGGQTVTHQHVGDVPVKVDQPSAAEKMTADQWGAEHTHSVYLQADADVDRNDQLRGDGQVLEVLAIVDPSRNTYSKAICTLVQHEGV
ncbi:phage head closure protein [Actinocorallia longicatena]|uniref:Head-tail adaptor protein n=1 Tax=Actinocorallia longicatena TaxID=111803 RepID=A0ABP6QE23_9ACTN